MSELAGVVLAERYLLLRRLSEGASGEIYLARHLGTGAMLAVKVLRPELAAQELAVERFLLEARATARVRHKHVVQVYDVGRSGAVVYIAMELLEGRALRGLLADGPLPWPFARELVLQLSAGLAAAHAVGIVHRDVKPDNVFVVIDDEGRAQVKLLDFGIARCDGGAGGRLAVPGRPFGTPDYMAPEQVHGHETDARTDVYGAGCVLFEMLMGRAPFAGGGIAEILRCQAEVEPPAVDRPDVPARLDAVMRRALAKRPRDRFASLEEMAAAIEALPEAPRAPSRIGPAPSQTITARVPVVMEPVAPCPDPKDPRAD